MKFFLSIVLVSTLMLVYISAEKRGCPEGRNIEPGHGVPKECEQFCPNDNPVCDTLFKKN